MCNTRKSQAGGVLPEIPHFATVVYKSTKHYPYDARKIWNDLHDDVPSATSLYSFRKNA